MNPANLFLGFAINLAVAMLIARLLADLRQRQPGALALTRVEVGTINYVNEWADVRVYYNARQAQGQHNSEESILNGDED